VTAEAIIRHIIGKVNPMPAKYEIGQKVTITPVSKQSLSTRDSVLRQHAGQTGEIINCYWIGPPTGEVFYLYTMRIGPSNKEIVLHEDEIERMKSKKPRRRTLKAR